MKRLLIAAVIAASSLGFATLAMAANDGDSQNLDQSRVADTHWAAASDPSFGAQSAALYNTDNGE
jgi:cytolysin (calcineurin-like family phosphatase)